ncbi:regulation of nuclear pre-mRNA domain-containing protein, partial [Trifolium medium]|nr:regulation of nuclear pre-mRNA domain-containing protein [Trifolium medium]
ATEATRVLEQNIPSVQPNSTPALPSFTQPTSFDPPLQNTVEDMKATVAAVAARLAASTSSAFMLSTALSSLVAEEAASMNGSLNSPEFNSAPPGFRLEKRPKLEQQMPVSDVKSSDIKSSSFFAPLQQPSSTNMPLPTPTMLSIS